jgi:prepilin-type N-terminal cleavage/methylation domain-containing protein
MINIKIPHLTNKYGFTLIELVVAFSIMAVLSTIGVASFVNYSQAQSLQQAVNDLTTTINTAKAKTATQVNDVCSGSSKAFSGYDVVLTKTTNPDSYTLNAICNGVEAIPPVTTTSFPKGVSLDSSMPNKITITFSVLTGAAKTTTNNIKIDGVTAQLSKTISIDSGGNIQVQ